MMDSSVDLPELAHKTKNFSGAEIEGLVKSASSYALQRQLSVENGVKVKEGEIKVTKPDFETALIEIKPAFGADKDEFEGYGRNGVFLYSEKIRKLLKNCELFVQQVRNSNRTPLVSFLLEGAPGSGKSSLAAKLAVESGYPFVRLISPETLLGLSELGRCMRIQKIFDDAYRSPLSCIVIDDIERLLDYVRVGPRFSNAVLQTLLVLLKKEPPKDRRLLILATSSAKGVLEDLELLDCFNASFNLPKVTEKDELISVLKELKFLNSNDEYELVSQAFTSPITIKKLIMLTEMAKQGALGTLVERFVQILNEIR